MWHSIIDTQHNNNYHYAECRVLFIIMLCVVLLIVIMLNVLAPFVRQVFLVGNIKLLVYLIIYTFSVLEYSIDQPQLCLKWAQLKKSLIMKFMKKCCKSYPVIKLGTTTLSIMTFSTTTLSIVTLSMKGLFVTFSIMTLSITSLCQYAECHYAECHVVLIIMLIVKYHYAEFRYA